MSLAELLLLCSLLASVLATTSEQASAESSASASGENVAFTVVLIVLGVTVVTAVGVVTYWVVAEQQRIRREGDVAFQTGQALPSGKDQSLVDGDHPVYAPTPQYPPQAVSSILNAGVGGPSQEAINM
jgi:hypothetical protein